MRKSTWNKVCGIMDSTRLTKEAKKDRILNIFAQQRYIDIPLLRGCLREIGYDPTDEEIFSELKRRVKPKSSRTIRITSHP